MGPLAMSSPGEDVGMLSPKPTSFYPKPPAPSQHHGAGLMPRNISFPGISLAQKPPAVEFPEEHKAEWAKRWSCPSF